MYLEFEDKRKCIALTITDNDSHTDKLFGYGKEPELREKGW
jgi:hypothetical protein